MFIYVDNIVFNFQKIGGISVYMTEILNRILDTEHDITCIEQKNVNNNILRKGIPIRKDKILLERNLPVRLISYMPIKLDTKDNVIVHSSYYRVCNSKNVANIITVYDFNYEFGFVRHGLRKYLHCRQKKYAANKADGVICISESTKHDLLSLYKNIEPEKVKVIHLAATSDFYKIDKSSVEEQIDPRFRGFINDKYILFVGARSHHKNFNVCVNTLSKLPNYKLVIVGATQPTEQELKSLKEKLPNRYHYINNVAARSLNILYNYAFCLMYPSSYEGFGIPVLEAMQAGCPVITTNRSSIPEVCGEAGLMVGEITPECFVEKIAILEGRLFREQIIFKGLLQVSKFSWEKTFSETMKFYKEIYNRKFGII